MKIHYYDASPLMIENYKSPFAWFCLPYWQAIL